MNKISTKDDYVKRMNTIVEYINDHLHEKLDLKKLAQISNFSVFHFHRIFKKHYQETLAVYISRNRVERAAYMLRYTNMSIKNIAYNVGFEFPSSLSKAFKQFYNISPTLYRKNKNHSITNIHRTKTKSNVEITPSRFVFLENKCVIYKRLVGPYNIMEHLDIWKQLLDYAQLHNLYSDKTEFISIYHNDISITEAHKLQSDICLTINKPVQAYGEIGVKEIQSGKYAVFVYDGPFNNTRSIYDSVFGKWLPASGYEVRELPVFEKYLDNPVQTENNTLRTELYLPIK